MFGRFRFFETDPNALHVVLGQTESVRAEIFASVRYASVKKKKIKRDNGQAPVVEPCVGFSIKRIDFISTLEQTRENYLVNHYEIITLRMCTLTWHFECIMFVRPIFNCITVLRSITCPKRMTNYLRSTTGLLENSIPMRICCRLKMLTVQAIRICRGKNLQF